MVCEIFAAEARAKIVYERLINFCRDPGTKDALQFLMTREITHMRAFSLALESMGKPPFTIGKIAPTPKLVDQFFNDSTGDGEYGEIGLTEPGLLPVLASLFGHSDRSAAEPHPRPIGYHRPSRVPDLARKFGSGHIQQVTHGRDNRADRQCARELLLQHSR